MTKEELPALGQSEEQQVQVQPFQEELQRRQQEEMQQLHLQKEASLQ